MSAVYRDLISPYSLRGMIRSGRLYAVLDATGFPDFQGQCRDLGLTPESLYSGDSGVEYQQEAPYMLILDRSTMGQWKQLLRHALSRDAGFSGWSAHSPNRIRLHWKRWLSVILPDNRRALFRFYDARILAAFLGAASAADAQAFFGPSDGLCALPGNGGGPIRYQLAAGDEDVPPARLGGGDLYRINDTQLAAMTTVTDDEYRAKMLRYLRVVWDSETAGKTDEELNDLVSDAVSLGERIGDTRRGVLTDLVVILLVAPELATEDRIQQVMNDPSVSPKQRSGHLIAPLAVRYSIPDRLDFFGKIQAFAEFDF